MRLFPLILIIFLLLSEIMAKPNVESNNKDTTLNIQKIAQGLEIPWAMTFINSNEILFTQRNGHFGILNTITKKITNIKSKLRVKHGGQGGLLDVAVSPSFKSNGLIYFTYVKEVNGLGVTALAIAKLYENRLIHKKDLLVTQSSSNTNRHFGSRITFDEEGHLFFGIGDRGVRVNAQDLTNHAGTILRLNLDGTVPLDNPFINNKNVKPEIYSYGHRNPQGLFYDKKRKKLYSIEHGPRGGDEINLIIKGANYGWPVISYGKEYYAPISVGEGTHKKGMIQPLKVYIPSIAPSSLIVYSGAKFPRWKGDLLSGALKLRHINRIKLDDDGKVLFEKRLLSSLNKRIRAIVESPKGDIYFSTDDGEIYLLMPN